LGEFLFELTWFTVQPIFTLYMIGLGATILQVGAILSVQSFLMIVARVPLTVVARRVGEIRMSCLAFIVQATAPILYSLAPSPTWLYFIPFYQVLSMAMFFQVALSMASNMAIPSRQGDALGRFMTISQTSMFIGPVICGSLLVLLNYSQLFLVASIFSWAGLLVFVRYAYGVSGSSSNEEKSDTAGSSMLNSIKIVISEKNVVTLSFIRTVYATSNTVFHTLFAIYAVGQLSFSPSAVAMLLSAEGLANTLIKIPTGRMSDRRGKRIVLLFTFCIVILDFLALSFARDLLSIGMLLIVFGACWGTRAVTEWALLASSVQPERKSFAMSYLETFWDVGAAAGGIAAGVLSGFMPISTIILLMAFVNVPALPAIYAMKVARNDGRS
jgi:predicted MFS family arabinose efflux permease